MVMDVLPGQILFTFNQLYGERKEIEQIKIRLFEAFSGYGSQSLTLDLLGVDYDHVGIAEIDPYAIKAHRALHGDVKNYGDVSKLRVDELPDMDLFTYSFPCQDISVAGKGKGLAKESGTRSSLLWECERIIGGKRPRFLMMENVKNLVGKANRPHFDEWLMVLDGFGYNNYWKVINAKEFGIPQNRERVFCVSILKEFDDGSFRFEEPFDNGLRLKDLLETEVDEKYYLEEEKVAKLIASTFNQERKRIQESGICDTLLARDYKDPKCIPIKANNQRGYDLAEEGDSINFENLASKTRRGRVGKGVAQTINTMTSQAVVEPNECVRLGNVYGEQFGTGYAGNVWDKEGCCPALMTMQGGGRQPHIITQYRIRKLTPKECFRLMGLNDDQIDKIQSAGISNSQQYKMAGNSIVVHQMAFLGNLPGIKKRTCIRSEVDL